MYGIVLIAVLVVTGGAIAVIGDRVGSRVGKKKLSLFGLRPRHTSVIVTIFTGILITMLTFAILAAVSENVRTALFGMEKLNRTMQETQERLVVTDEKLRIAREQQEKAAADLETATREVEKLQEKQAALEKRAKELAAESERLERAKEELTAQNNQLAAGNADLMVANNVLLAGNEKLTADNKELEERANDLRQGILFMREGDIIFRAGEILSSGVIHGNRTPKEVAADIDALIQLATRNSSQRLGVNDETSEIWVFQPEFEKSAQTIAESKDDMVVRIVAAGNLVRGEPVRTNIQLFKNSIVYRKDEFIIARPFQINGANPGEAERVVMAFLKDVNAAATSRGILPDPIRGSVGVMEGSQFYEVVQALVPIKGPIILSAYARSDTDALGPLRLNLKLESEAVTGGSE